MQVNARDARYGQVEKWHIKVKRTVYLIINCNFIKELHTGSIGCTYQL